MRKYCGVNAMVRIVLVNVTLVSGLGCRDNSLTKDIEEVLAEAHNTTRTLRNIESSIARLEESHARVLSGLQSRQEEPAREQAAGRPQPNGSAAAESGEELLSLLRTLNERLAEGDPHGNWSEYIDPGLAQVLIESGQTPFSPGVGIRLSVASEELRKGIEDAWVRLKWPIPQTPAEYINANNIAEAAKADQDYNALRKRIIEQFKTTMRH